MKKTIKIIDLLNLIANGEEVPKKIDYNEEIFIYNETLKRYVHEINKYSDSSTYCLGGYFALDMSLDHEVKVLEELEDKEFEDIEPLVLRTFERTGQAITTDRLEDYCDYNFEMIENTIAKIVLNQKKIIERLKESE